MTRNPVLGEDAHAREHSTTFAGIVGVVPLDRVLDLPSWVDPRLELVDPERAFFKFYALRRRPEAAEVDIRFLQYHQVCLSTLATYDGGDPMHVNLIMWEDQDWAALANRAAMGWPKRMADIVGTWLFPSGQHDLDPGWDRFDFSVIRHGRPQVELRSHIERWGEAPPPPPFDGYLTVRPPVPLSEETSRPIFRIRPYDWAVRPVGQGRAHVSLGDLPAADESFTPRDVLGRDELESTLGLHYVRWTIDPSVNTKLAS